MIIGYENAMAAFSKTAVGLDLLGASNVFVIGPTGVGKSTFCGKLMDLRRGPVIHARASDWIRARVPCPEGASRSEYAALMAAESVKILAKDPDVCVRQIQAQFNCAEGGCAIDGLRNPADFIKLFRPELDYVVVLQRQGVSCCNSFEEGIGVIEAHAVWCERNLRVGRIAALPDIVFKVDLTEVPLEETPLEKECM